MFLQSPWGAALVTAVFFLVIMVGVAVMAKNTIDSRFAEASKPHEENHAAKMNVHLVRKLATENAHGDSCEPVPSGNIETPEKPNASKAPQIQLALIGVMIESGTETHPFIKDLWSDLSAVKAQ